MKIVQLLPTMAFGDAVSNDAAAIDRMLSDMGYKTELYASNVDPRLPAGTAAHWKKMKDLHDEDLLIFHASTGDPLNRRVSSFGGRKMMIYHNITPSSFFRGYSRAAEELTETGRRQIRRLSDQFRYCVADSDYNRFELRQMGYQCPIDVCPIIIPFEDYEKEPDRKVIGKYKNDGWTNLLFVGRTAPNKKQEDVIRAFYYYHRDYNPKSRLFLVGSDTGMENYRYQLENYARALGLAGRVIFPGHISFAAILAYYRLADLFVCMSEHEGFCVPLVEAMYFDLPIVAYASSAIPETLGKGGLLLDSKDPQVAAAAIDRMLRDRELRGKIAEERKARLARYRYDQVSTKMKECILKLAGGKQ